MTLIGFALALSRLLGRERAGERWTLADLDVRYALAGAAVALFLVNASYYMWWGGAAFGPRHLLTVVPLAAYGIARAWLDREARVLTIVLAAISFASVLVVTMIGLEAPEQGNVLTDYAWLHLSAGNVAVLSGASNLGMRLGLPSLATFGPILVWLVIGGRVVAKALPKAEPDHATLTPEEPVGSAPSPHERTGVSR